MAVIRKPKSIRIAFRATAEDGKMLNALIEKTGMGGSDVIRLAIRRLHHVEVEGHVSAPTMTLDSLLSRRYAKPARRKPRKKN